MSPTLATNPHTELTTESALMWNSLHVFIHDFSKHDHFLNECIAQLPETILQNTFFVRYWEGGPHIRLRTRAEVNTQQTFTTEQLEFDIKNYLSKNNFPSNLSRDDFYAQYRLQQTAQFQASWYPHLSVEKIAYHAETQRYGGQICMALCEEHFCKDSALTLRLLHKTKSQRHALAFAYCIVYLEQLQFFKVDSWELSGIKELHPDQHERSVIKKQSQQRYSGIKSALQTQFEAITSPTSCTMEVRLLRAQLKALFPQFQTHAQIPLVAIANSLLHMSFNRLGIAPSEEAQLRYLAVNTFNESA